MARLAALGGSNSRSSSQVNNSTSNSPSQEPSTPKEEPKQVLQSQSSNLPSETSNVKPVTTPKAPTPKVPAFKTTPSDSSISKLSTEEQIAKWLSTEIEGIFQATIDKSHTSTGLIYLGNLSSELESEKRLLSKDNLESVFMEILNELGVPAAYKSPVEYLFQIYQRAFRLKRIVPRKDPLHDTKISIVNSIISLSCSYGFICFQVPDMYVNNNIKLAIDVLTNNPDMSGFLVDIVNESVEQESLLEFLNIIFPTLSAKLYNVNLNDSSYSKYLSIFETLVSIKSVAAIFSQVDGFQPPNKKEGLDFENKTLLGSLLRLSPLLDSVSKYYFTENVGNLSKVQVNSTYESLQNEYKVVSDRLFFIVDKLIRGSSHTRQAILTWFGDLINLSHLRRGSHADLNKLPSDGIMFNISLILIKLSLPFLEYPTFSKLDKIDGDYFGRSNLINISEESRVNSSIPEANDYYNGLDKSTPPNFISDCFFLTLTYLHYGVGGIYNHHDRLKNQIKQMTSRVEMIENNQVPPGTNPMMAHVLRSQLPMLTKSLNSMKATKHSIQAIFSFRSMQLDMFDFIIGATTFITKLIDPSHQHPRQKLKIPLFKIDAVSQLDDHEFLQTKTPVPWKYYPEFMLEGIINYCKFITNFRGCPLVDNHEKLLSFVEFSIILLRCPELIGNPHMKAHLVEVLFIGSLPMMNGEPGFISNIFNTNQLVIDNILYSLLDFYVMVEKTGASSQFYDKFNSRYYISVILEELWKNEIYREQLADYSRNNVDFFIRFIARMLNDTTYLLDETFNELNLIHNYQRELEKRANGQPPNTEELGSDEELTNNLNSSERKAKSYVGLSNKTMELFKLFSKQTPQGFELPEIVDRLAGMLNYNLQIMVGPKCSNLKVRDPMKYDFDPKRTLSDLCEIYCNLSNQGNFIVAVARDTRSFSLEYFKKAERILSTRTYTSPKVIENLIKFAQKADEQRQTDEDEELELGEVPDEFLDPLMFILMEDPVILPGSKISIDRSTIKAHLLSDSTDPFNRMPLKLEDVVEDVELKKKIQEFKRLKKAEKLSQNQDVEMTDA